MDKIPLKKKIAVKVRNVQILTLIVTLGMIAVMISIIVTGITNDTARNIALLYSTEALRRFNYYVNQDLILVRKISRSKAIRNWFTDENDPLKKAAAYDEMMDYTGIQHGSNLYIVTETDNEYSISGETVFENFNSFSSLDPSNPDDDWYFECVKSKNDYTINFDIDKATKIPRLWINHKVVDDDNNLLGVFCAGILLDEMIGCLFAQYDNETTKGYIIDRHGYIQIDAAMSISFLEEKKRINTLYEDPLFDSAIYNIVYNIDGYFDMEAQPTVLILKGVPYGHVSIAPIAGTDWSIVTFFDKNSLYSITAFLPLIFIMLFFLVVCMLVNDIYIDRQVLLPLNMLTKSLAASKFYAGEIYGSEREDEIGNLALTIQKMRDRLSTYNAELLRAARERERLIRIDQLTDIPNRRSFDERLPLEWGRAVRTQTPISLLFVDLDHFKNYNDTYGHLQGDKALQAAAKIFILELRRSGDLVARWGGEEFAILLVNTELTGALEVAERIRQGVESMAIPLEDGSISKITISIGVNTIIPTVSNILEDFIRHTDMALYAAKREGRNRVCKYVNVLLS